MPFGEELFPDTVHRTVNQKYSSQTDQVRQKFTGYQKDEETNLDFAEARMYQNSHGRFTAVDPLLASGKSANPQTFNRYVYCLNNPLIFTDPNGMQTGQWYRPVQPDGVKTFRYESSQPDGYEEVTERNQAGDLIAQAVGLKDSQVLRFNPLGPGGYPNFRTFINDAADGLLGGNPYFRNGYDVTYTDEFRASVNNDVNPGVRDVSFEFYMAVLPAAQGAGSLAKAGMNSFRAAALGAIPEESVTLFRGVNQSNAAYNKALNGIVEPNGGIATPLEHNTISTLNSPFTSWTTNRSVAENFALRPGNTSGVILETTVPISRTVASPNLKSVVLIQNGQVVSESEVLLRGIVRGTTTSQVP